MHGRTAPLKGREEDRLAAKAEAGVGTAGLRGDEHLGCRRGEPHLCHPGSPPGVETGAGVAGAVSLPQN